MVLKIPEMDFILMLNNTIKANGPLSIIGDLNTDLSEVGLLNFVTQALTPAEEGDIDEVEWYLEATFDTPNTKSSEVFLEALNTAYPDLNTMVFTYMSDDQEYKEFVFSNGSLVHKSS